MKKLSFLIVSTALLLFQACKEIGPQIDFGPSGNDTTYKTTPETPQARKVLAEEFTGVSCPPCPKGHDIMKAISTNLDGNLVIVAYHIFNYPQSAPVTDPAHKSQNDFRTEDATEVGNAIYGGISGMPVAGFDRTPLSGTISLGPQQWSNAASTAATAATPVNIHITSSFDAATREATAVVTLAYTADVSLKQNLTVLLTENEIIDVQKKELEVINDYKHEHVLRKIITPVVGKQIPDDQAKEPGLVFQSTFTFPVDAEWNAEHCNVIAFVTNNDASNRQVVNAEEVKLTE